MGLPPKKNQKPEDRAKDIEGVLNWMRTNNVSPVSPYENSPGAFDKLSSIPINRRSPEDRERDVDDITDWIRSGKPSEPGRPCGEFERIDQMLPQKKNQNPDIRAKDIEGVLNWMRSSNVSPIAPYENTPGSFEILSHLPVDRRPPKERQSDVDDITDWIRSGKPSEPDSSTGEFERIDQMLPQKKNQKPEDRAKDIEGVLNWMRNNNVSPIAPYENTPGSFEVLSHIPMNKRPPKERQSDVDDIT